MDGDPLAFSLLDVDKYRVPSQCVLSLAILCPRGWFINNLPIFTIETILTQASFHYDGGEFSAMLNVLLFKTEVEGDGGRKGGEHTSWFMVHYRGYGQGVLITSHVISSTYIKIILGQTQ